MTDLTNKIPVAKDFKGGAEGDHTLALGGRAPAISLSGEIPASSRADQPATVTGKPFTTPAGDHAPALTTGSKGPPIC